MSKYYADRNKYFVTKDSRGYRLWYGRPYFKVWTDIKYRVWVNVGVYTHSAAAESAPRFERRYPHLKMRAGKYAIVEIEKPILLKAKK